MTTETNNEELLQRTIVRIRRIDEDRKIVYGLVYEPDILDTFGEFMMAEDIETMCHRFAELTLGEIIDTNHDNIPNGSFPVESFIIRNHDPDFPVGGWVLGVKISEDHIWRQIKKGELNGFSFEALVKPVSVLVHLQTVRDHVGETESQKSDESGHEHVFFAQVNDSGRVTRGYTSVVDGHSHDIRRGTFTEPGGTDKHTHRFFL